MFAAEPFGPKRLSSAGLKWLRRILGIAAMFLLVRSLYDGMAQVQDQVVISARDAMLAVVVSGISAFCLGKAWATLVSDLAGDRTRATEDFLLSIPAKYLPGGFFQQLSLIDRTVRASPRTTVSSAITAAVIHGLVGGIAAALLGSAVSLRSSLPLYARMLAGLGLLTPLLLTSQAEGLLRSVLSVRGTGRLADLSIPSVRRRFEALSWGIPGVAGSAASFVLLAHDSLDDPIWLVGSGFASAFLIGYVALPFPAGLGVREVSLAALFGATALPVLTAISLTHRLTATIAEMLSFLGAHAARTLRSQARGKR